MKLSKTQLRVRRFIKRFLYSQVALRESLMVLLGKGKPFIQFKVEATPPSIYYNFVVRADQVQALQADLDIPYPLARIRCLAGEEPFYCLTLNVYRVSGITDGIRAEWSAYIRDDGGKPRYMVVEARADGGSMDPIDIITKASRVEHSADAKWITSIVDSDAGTRFEARVPLPEESQRAGAAPEWIEANDYIYWANGICDRTFYNAGMAFGDTRISDLSAASFQDDTRWSKYLERVPQSVVVVHNEIELVISPWWNLGDL